MQSFIDFFYIRVELFGKPREQTYLSKYYSFGDSIKKIAGYEKFGVFPFEISFLLAHGRSLPEKKCDGFEVLCGGKTRSFPQKPNFRRESAKKVPNKGGKLFYEGGNRCALRSPQRKKKSFFRLPFLRVCCFLDRLILLCWSGKWPCVCVLSVKKSLFALSDNRMRCSSAYFFAVIFLTLGCIKPHESYRRVSRKVCANWNFFYFPAWL